MEENSNASDHLSQKEQDKSDVRIDQDYLQERFANKTFTGIFNKL